MHLCLADEKNYCDRFFFHVALISEEVEREDIQEDYGRGGVLEWVINDLKDLKQYKHIF